MSEKFTPGPWRVEYPIGTEHAEIRDMDGRRIAVAIGVYPMRVKTEDANAHLIASAPEMYEALLKCVSADPTIVTNRPGWMDYIASIEGARAALKKARGEQ